MREKGFSVLEVILAAAFFMIFATAAVVAVLQGFNANRLGAELSIANQFASEGIEAVKSIKNRGYANLTNFNTVGIQQNTPGNYWEFKTEGSNNTLVHNSQDNFIRTIKIDDVQRDGSGNIVASGGTLDPDTKRITSKVDWQFTSAKPETVSLVTYLSDWRKPLSINVNGVLFYGESGSNNPKYRDFYHNTNSFTSETLGPTGATGLNFIAKTSPIKREAVVGYTTSSGVLRVLCYDGSSWTEDWTVTVGGTGTTRRFDISYETNSGDVIVLYSTNTATNNEMAYRTKAGSVGCGASSWSSATTISATRTSGIVQWVNMVADRRSGSNLIAAIWADANRGLSSFIWSGTSWGNEPSAALETALEIIGTAQDVESFDLDYESISGNLMVVWGSGGSGSTNGAYFSRCTGGSATCTWSSPLKNAMPTFANDATNLDLAANPNTDEMVFASIGNGGADLQAGYWSGSAWTNRNDLDGTSQAPAAGTKLIATGWLISGSTTRSLVVYGDSSTTATDISYYTGNGGTFTLESDWQPSPVLGTHRYYDIQMDPFNKDTLMFTIADNNLDLFAKRLVMSATPTFAWSNSDGGALETALPQALRTPFSFAYWRNP